MSALATRCVWSAYFVIESNRSSYYEPESPHFGDEVAAKFSSVAYDINEARKCLALDRSTASAFHSISLHYAAP